MSDKNDSVEHFEDNSSVTSAFPCKLLINRWLRYFAIDDPNAFHKASGRIITVLNALRTLAESYNRKVLEPPQQDDIHASLQIQVRNACIYLERQFIRHRDLYTLLQELRDGRPKSIEYWQAFRHYTYFIFQNFLSPYPVVNSVKLPYFFYRRIEGVALALMQEDKVQFCVRVVSLLREYMDVALENYARYEGPPVDDRHFAYVSCLMSYYCAFISATLKLTNILAEFEHCIGVRFHLNWYLFNQRIFYQYFYQRPEVQKRISEFCAIKYEPQRPGVINLLSAFSHFVESMKRLNCHWKIQLQLIDSINERNARRDKNWMDKDWELFEKVCRISKSNYWFIRSEQEKTIQDIEELDAQLLELVSTTWFNTERLITLAGTCTCEDCMLTEFYQVLLSPTHRLRNNIHNSVLQRGGTDLYEIPVPVIEVLTAEPDLIRLTSCCLCKKTILLSAYCEHVVNVHPPTVEELQAEQEEAKAAKDAAAALKEARETRSAQKSNTGANKSDDKTESAMVPRKIPEHVKELGEAHTSKSDYFDNRIRLIVAEKNLVSSLINLVAEDSPHFQRAAQIDGTAIVEIGISPSVDSNVKALNGMLKAVLAIENVERDLHCDAYEAKNQSNNKQFSTQPPLHKHVTSKNCVTCLPYKAISTNVIISNNNNTLHCSHCCNAKKPSSIRIAPVLPPQESLLPFGSSSDSEFDDNYHCHKLVKEVVVMKSQSARVSKDSHNRTKQKVEKAADTMQQLLKIVTVPDSYLCKDFDAKGNLPSTQCHHNGNRETNNEILPEQAQDLMESTFMLTYGTSSPIIFDKNYSDPLSSDHRTVCLEDANTDDYVCPTHRPGPKSGKFTEANLQSVQPCPCMKILYHDIDKEPSAPSPFSEELDPPDSEAVLNEKITTPLSFDEFEYQYCQSQAKVYRPRKFRICAPSVRMDTHAPAPGFWFPDYLEEQINSMTPIEDPPELFVDAKTIKRHSKLPNPDSMQHADGLDGVCRFFEAFLRDAERMHETAERNCAKKIYQTISPVIEDTMFEDANGNTTDIANKRVTARCVNIIVNSNDDNVENVAMDDDDINIENMDRDAERDLGSNQESQVPHQGRRRRRRRRRPDDDSDEEMSNYIPSEHLPPMNPSECEQFLEILRDAAELAYFTRATEKIDASKSAKRKKGNSKAEADQLNKMHSCDSDKPPQQQPVPSQPPSAGQQSLIPPGCTVDLEEQQQQRQQQLYERLFQRQQYEQLFQQEQLQVDVQEEQGATAPRLHVRFIIPAAIACAAATRAQLVDTVVRISENHAAGTEDCATMRQTHAPKSPSAATVTTTVGMPIEGSGASIVSSDESVVARRAPSATTTILPAVTGTSAAATFQTDTNPKISRIHSKRTLLRAARTREPIDHDLFVSCGFADKRQHGHVLDGMRSCFDDCRHNHGAEHYDDNDDNDYSEEDDEDIYDDSAKRRRANLKAPLPEPELCEHCKSPLDSNIHILCLELQANKEANKYIKKNRQKARRQVARQEREELANKLKERQRQIEVEKRIKREKKKHEQELEQRKFEEKKRLDRQRELAKRAALKAEKEREAFKRLEQSRRDKAKEAAKRAALHNGGKKAEKQPSGTLQNLTSKPSKRKNRRKKKALDTPEQLAVAQHPSDDNYDNSSNEPSSSDGNKRDPDSDQENNVSANKTVELPSTIRIDRTDFVSTITVSLKGVRPGEDKVLYTIVDGHPQVPEPPLELTEAAAKLIPSSDISALDNRNLTKKQRKKKAQQLNKLSTKLSTRSGLLQLPNGQVNANKVGSVAAETDAKSVVRNLSLYEANSESQSNASSATIGQRPFNLPDNVNIPAGITITNVPQPAASSAGAKNKQPRDEGEQIASGAILKNSAFSSANRNSNSATFTTIPSATTSYIHNRVRAVQNEDSGNNAPSQSVMYQQSLHREVEKQWHKTVEQSAYRSTYVPFYMTQPKTGSPIVLETLKLISQGATKKKRNKKKLGGTPANVTVTAVTASRRNRRAPIPPEPAIPPAEADNENNPMESKGGKFVKLKNPIFHQQMPPLQTTSVSKGQLLNSIQRDQLSAQLSEHATISMGKDGNFTIRRSGLISAEDDENAMSIPEFLRNQPDVQTATEWKPYSIFLNHPLIVQPTFANLHIVDILSSNTNSNNPQNITTTAYHENDIRLNTSESDKWNELLSKLASDVTVLQTTQRGRERQPLPAIVETERRAPHTLHESYETSNFFVDRDNLDNVADEYADREYSGQQYDTVSRLPPHLLDRRAPIVPNVTLYNRNSGYGVPLNNVLPQYTSKCALERALAMLTIGAPNRVATRGVAGNGKRANFEETSSEQASGEKLYSTGGIGGQSNVGAPGGSKASGYEHNFVGASSLRSSDEEPCGVAASNVESCSRRISNAETISVELYSGRNSEERANDGAPNGSEVSVELPSGFEHSAVGFSDVAASGGTASGLRTSHERPSTIGTSGERSGDVGATSWESNDAAGSHGAPKKWVASGKRLSDMWANGWERSSGGDSGLENSIGRTNCGASTSWGASPERLSDVGASGVVPSSWGVSCERSSDNGTSSCERSGVGASGWWIHRAGINDDAPSDRAVNHDRPRYQGVSELDRSDGEGNVITNPYFQFFSYVPSEEVQSSFAPVRPPASVMEIAAPIGPPSPAVPQNILQFFQQGSVGNNRIPWLDTGDLINYNPEILPEWYDENVFAPKESVDGELDPEERDVEAFKRFCQQSIPPERKEKVTHLNVRDIIIKKKTKNN